MKPLPFESLPAATVFAAAFAGFVLVNLQMGGAGWWGGASTLREPALDRGSLLVVALTTALGFGIGFPVSNKVLAATIAPDSPVARWSVFILGIVVMVAGSLFRLWAIRTLGHFFTADVRVVAGQHVVTSGPYRRVRHPSYTGLIVAFAGMGLALGNWLSLLVLIVLPLVGLVFRIHVEEAALLAKLGDPYAQYMSRTKRLLPGVW